MVEDENETVLKQLLEQFKQCLFVCTYIHIFENRIITVSILVKKNNKNNKKKLDKTIEKCENTQIVGTSLLAL